MCTSRCWSMSQCKAIARGEDPWAKVDEWKHAMARAIFRAPYDELGVPLPKKGKLDAPSKDEEE